MNHRFALSPLKNSWFSGIAALLMGAAGPGLLALSANAATGVNPSVAAREAQALDQYHKVVSPILKSRCYECHGDGARKAGLAFDTLATNDQILRDPQLRLKVLCNTRSHKLIFFGSGTEDTAVNGGRALHAAFTEKGIKHLWSEDPGYGHDYQIWRIYLHTLLQKTFRD